MAVYTPLPPTSLRSKLDRAIVAYLISVGIGDQTNVLPHKTHRKMDALPLVIVRSTVGMPEGQDGNDRIRVRISILGSAGVDEDEPNPVVSRVNHDALIGKVRAALRQSDNGGATLDATCVLINVAGRALAVPADASPEAALVAQNNADMADFTLDQWYDAGFGDGEPLDSAYAWEEVLLFDAVACELNVD